VPPAFRVNGEIILADEDALSQESATEIAYALLNDQQKRKFDDDWELCISLVHSAAGRVRVTFYKRNGFPELSFRLCGERISTRDELGLPIKLDELARRPNGLVLVTGPTGAGKTTTLNYMVDLIKHRASLQDCDHRRPDRIRPHQQAGDRSATRGAHRCSLLQPGIIPCVAAGSRRARGGGDAGTSRAISTALTAAETGHLVLATMHSPNVIHPRWKRIIGVFEGSAQRQIILQLSNALQGIHRAGIAARRGQDIRRVMAY
jgi:twitching motility protein PilT